MKFTILKNSKNKQRPQIITLKRFCEGMLMLEPWSLVCGTYTF